LRNGATVNGQETGYGSQGWAARDLYFEMENIVGSNFGDSLTGNQQRNQINGLDGDDIIFGYGNVDYLKGGAGNDTLNGGASSDYAIFDGNAADYTLTKTSSTTVTVVGPDGTDSLIDIEYFQFDDATLNIWGLAQATLPEQARMIAEFIEAEGLGKPLIVGHSLGGAIAETLALNHPDQVGALALICPATDDVEKTPDAFKGIDIPVPALIPVVAHLLAGALSLLMERKIFAQIFAPEPVGPDFLVRGGAILGRTPQGFIAAAQDLAMTRASVADVLGREAEIKVPVGVLYGASDAILDPQKHGAAFAEKTGGSYADLDGRGHMIPFTAPADCAAFVREMAARIG
jgi:pimeloyl-ACP methyl ester carboxylesterase